MVCFAELQRQEAALEVASPSPCSGRATSSSLPRTVSSWVGASQMMETSNPFWANSALVLVSVCNVCEDYHCGFPLFFQLNNTTSFGLSL